MSSRAGDSLSVSYFYLSAGFGRPFRTLTMSYLVPTTQRTVTSCMAEGSAALDAIRTSLGDIDITLSGNVVSTNVSPSKQWTAILRYI